jgi:hypothetical protein
MHITKIESPMYINYIKALVHKTCDNLKKFGGHVINTHQLFKYNNKFGSLNKLN